MLWAVQEQEEHVEELKARLRDWTPMAEIGACRYLGTRVWSGVKHKQRAALIFSLFMASRDMGRLQKGVVLLQDDNGMIL